MLLGNRQAIPWFTLRTFPGLCVTAITLRKRLDTLLAERGLFESRSRAAAPIVAALEGHLLVRLLGAAPRLIGLSVVLHAENLAMLAPPQAR